MTLVEHITYGNLMSMGDKYLMRCLSEAIRPLEIESYELDGSVFVINIFDPNWEKFNTSYQYTLRKERSSIASQIMEALK